MAKLIMTVEEMQDRDKWLEMRKAGIGGSEAAAIVGLNPWKSAFQLWREKTGQVEPADLSDNEFVYWGNVLEQAVADRFCELAGKKVQRRGMLQDDEYQYMLASVDRMVVGENAGLECKTTNAFNGKAWDGDELPDSYYVQCQWYMMITGCEKWYIAVLIGGNKFVWKEVSRNEADIEAIRKAAVEFWGMVETNTMPPVDGSSDCGKALSERFSAEKGKAIDLPTAAKDCIDRIREIKETIARLEEQKQLSENELKAMLGDAEIGVIGEDKVTWKEQAGRTTLDSKRLKAEAPELYSKYSKVGNPIRVFKVG